MTRVLTLRELNRTLLDRQLLLGRKRVPVARAVGRLVALQAQAGYSPYVALWSRLAGLRKEQLTRALVDGSVVKAGAMRETLHVVSRELYPSLLAAQIERLRARTEKLPTPPEELAARWPDEPVQDTSALAAELLGIDDRWTVAFTCRALPWLRTEPVGEWPHNKPSANVLWREPLPPADEGAARVVRAYLAAYGPAAREDVEQFTSFKVRQIAPALEGLPTFEDETGRVLYDLPRAALSLEATDAPVRFLPAFDSIILAHRDRSRILPDEYREAVLRKANAVTLATVTVDGFIAGSWRAEKARAGWRVTAEPFEPLPRAARDQVEAERARLEAFYNAS